MKTKTEQLEDISSRVTEMLSTPPQSRDQDWHDLVNQLRFRKKTLERELEDAARTGDMGNVNSVLSTFSKERIK